MRFPRRPGVTVHTDPLLSAETMAEALSIAYPGQHVMMRMGGRDFSIPPVDEGTIVYGAQHFAETFGPVLRPDYPGGAYTGTILAPRPFDWSVDAPEVGARDFPPLVFGGRGTVLTPDVLEEVRTRLYRRLSAGDVDSGLWGRTS